MRPGPVLPPLQMKGTRPGALVAYSPTHATSGMRTTFPARSRSPVDRSRPAISAVLSTQVPVVRDARAWFGLRESSEESPQRRHPTTSAPHEPAPIAASGVRSAPYGTWPMPSVGIGATIAVIRLARRRPMLLSAVCLPFDHASVASGWAPSFEKQGRRSANRLLTPRPKP